MQKYCYSPDRMYNGTDKPVSRSVGATGDPPYYFLNNVPCEFYLSWYFTHS
uniref:Uncharacterized protein n=1 Tax=Arundo donax TaxID=35708 RepID=A0A0A9C9P4_ARUDO